MKFNHYFLVLALSATAITFAETDEKSWTDVIQSVIQDLTKSNEAAKEQGSGANLDALATNVAKAQELYQSAKDKVSQYTDKAKDLYSQYVQAVNLFKSTIGSKAENVQAKIKAKQEELSQAPADLKAAYNDELQALQNKYEKLKDTSKEVTGDSLDWGNLLAEGKKILQNSGLLEGLFGDTTGTTSK